MEKLKETTTPVHRTESERDVLDARKLPADVLEELRRRAVAAVETGIPQAHVARVLGLSRQTVNEWVKAYRAQGDEAFRPKRRGRRPGEQRALAPGQQNEIVQKLLSSYPDDFGLKYMLWTRQAVSELIHQRFGIALSTTSVGNYLREWGLMPVNPLRRALQQNTATVSRWLETDYPAIARTARSEGAEILWADQISLPMQRGSAPGPAPVMMEKSGWLDADERSEARVLAAVTNRGRVLFAVHSGALEAKPLCEFLRRLTCQANRKVFVIAHRHPVHRSRTLRTWLKTDNDRIVMYFLPS